MMETKITTCPSNKFLLNTNKIVRRWCSIFNADLALSVTMTAISTVLAVVMLPLNLFIYLPMAYKDNEEVDVFQILDFRVLLSSLVVVFSAIGLGVYASGRVTHPKFHVYANRVSLR